ncbi:unnamed protein product [Sphagnum balticum]
MTAGVRPLLELVNVTLVILQSPDIIISQQTSKIENLVGHLAGTMNMELMGTNETFKAMQASKFIVVDHWRAKRDSNNEAALDLTPPMMPFQLVEMARCDFIDSIFNPYRNQLAKFWPNEKIDFIERHQQELFNAYKREPGSKLLIDKQDHTTLFNMGWDDLKGRFEHL